MKISKNKKMRFFLMSQGSFNPKNRFLCQKVCSFARGHTYILTDRQTDTKVNTEDTLSGFQFFYCFNYHQGSVQYSTIYPLQRQINQILGSMSFRCGVLCNNGKTHVFLDSSVISSKGQGLVVKSIRNSIKESRLDARFGVWVRSKEVKPIICHLGST